MRRAFFGERGIRSGTRGGAGGGGPQEHKEPGCSKGREEESDGEKAQWGEHNGENYGACPRSDKHEDEAEDEQRRGENEDSR